MLGTSSSSKKYVSSFKNKSNCFIEIQFTKKNCFNTFQTPVVERIQERKNETLAKTSGAPVNQWKVTMIDENSSKVNFYLWRKDFQKKLHLEGVHRISKVWEIRGNLWICDPMINGNNLTRHYHQNKFLNENISIDQRAFWVWKVSDSLFSPCPTLEKVQMLPSLIRGDPQ